MVPAAPDTIKLKRHPWSIVGSLVDNHCMNRGHTINDKAQRIRTDSKEAVRLVQELGLAVSKIEPVRNRLDLSEHLAKEA